MAYVLAGLLVLLIVGTAVFVATRSGRRQRTPIATDRSSPWGDTSEHAGEQSGGETVADPEVRSRG
jgi:hypothetical protein